MREQQQFLSDVRRIAFYGLKREGKGFAHDVLNGIRRGRATLEVAAIRPDGEAVTGVTVATTAQQLDPPVDGAVIVLKPEDARGALDDALAAGIRRIWLVMNAGSRENLARAREQGAQVVNGCPLLFIPEAGFPHTIHRWLAKLFGRV